MPFTHSSDFDRARRRLYIRHNTTAKRIGAVRVAENDAGGIPVYLPVSIVLEDQDEYIESNGFYNKVNSVDAWQQAIFVPPPWGEVESVEATNKTKMEFFAADAPDTMLHSFDEQ